MASELVVSQLEVTYLLVVPRVLVARVHSVVDGDPRGVLRLTLGHQRLVRGRVRVRVRVRGRVRARARARAGARVRVRAGLEGQPRLVALLGLWGALLLYLVVKPLPARGRVS